MGKISIGLRGWRFDEAAVFADDGALRPPEEMDEDVRRRLLRLPDLVGRPCHACWLEHGSADACEAATAVYGEPLAEVLLCDAHERDFYYWFETEGEAFVGEAAFQDRFHEWFAAGNRAPEGYAGVEHVETDPDDLPEPVLEEGTAVFDVTLPEGEAVSVDLRQYGDDELDGREGGAGIDLDLDADYPAPGSEGPAPDASPDSSPDPDA